MGGLHTIERALLSVSDKSGIVEFARALTDRGVEIISTGGTARALREAGIPVRAVEELTGFPEMMDGRLKTLHPKVHGGILALRNDPDHRRSMQEHGIAPIDLVCINLYPFEQTISRPGVTRHEAIEQIDIGGPAMIRAAAKNHAFVTVVTSPSQYPRVMEEIRANAGAVGEPLRAELAAAAFERTAGYDAAIARYLAAQQSSEAFPPIFSPVLRKVQDLRYGENPHQQAALYKDPQWIGPAIVGAEQLHGKELSYNNLNDAAAALSLSLELAAVGDSRHAASVIKHANPCGAAVASNPAEAVELALRGDPVAAYGGILALSSTLTYEAARHLCAQGVYFEVIIASEFEPEALKLLRAKSANVRLLRVDGSVASARRERTIRTIPGGALVQDADTLPCSTDQWLLRAGPAPTPERLRHAGVVWTVAKHLSSNAIAIGGADGSGVRLFGAGAGQMDRVTACRLAAEKAGESARGAIAASDAFFPFPDGPEILIRAGVSLIVHPGGSKRDQETFDLCESRGVTCLTTGVRHFRH